ncbi:hypothetical protein KAR91_38140 [Candidatus Pacearchaeota archaeon]|nr:hypothetical protein [Candidatus Pacearchaeota archaeon]
MPDTTDSSTINPQVRETDIGKRTLRKVSIYPLSLADQLNLTDLITEAMTAFFNTNPEESDESMVQFIGFMIDLIKKNIDKLVETITDEGKGILEEITNVQLMNIAEIIYVDNFEGPVKKAMSLFLEKRPMGSESPSPKPLRRAVKSTPSRSTVSTP